MKNTIKKLTTCLLSLTIIFSTWNLVMEKTAHAGVNQVSRNLCSLAVYPFKAGANELKGEAGLPWVKFLDNMCDNFVTYPNAYAPQPPKKEDSPLPAGALEKNVPYARHFHAYYNDSVEDNYYYVAGMDKFEITVESDGFNSIDINSIKCGTWTEKDYPEAKLAPINDCDGTVNDLFGGTTVSKKTVGNNVVITWDFATIANAEGKHLNRPQIWADNGSNFVLKKPGSNPPEFQKQDFGDEEKRKMEFFVDFKTKDNNEIWSATTTSRALIAHLGVNKSNYPQNFNKPCTNENNNMLDINESQNGWCYLPTPNNADQDYTEEIVHADKNRTFHWFPIGSVATVWREKEQPKVCQSLELFDTPQLLTPEEVQQNTGSANNWPMYKISLKKVQFEGNVIPAGTKIKWKSTDPNGRFWVPGFFGGLANLGKNEFESFYTPPVNDDFIYYTGNGPVEASLTNIPAELNSALCKDSVPIPAQNICENLDATLSQNTININGKKAYPINVTKIAFAPQNSIPANAKILWKTDNPNGEFWKDTFLYGDNPDGSDDIATQIMLGKGQVKTATNEKKLYYIGKANDKIEITLTDIPAAQISDSCKAPLTIPGEIECKDLLVDHASKIFVGTYSTFKSKSIDTNNKAMTNKVRYWVDKGHGEFFLNKPNSATKNPSAMIYEIGGANQNWSEILKESVVDKSELSKAFQDTIIDLATGNNQSYGDGTPKNPAKPGMTIDPADYGMGMDFSYIGKSSFASVLAVNIGDLGIGKEPIAPSIKDLLGDNEILIEKGLGADIPLPPAIEEIIVDQNKTIYFVAKKPGKKVIHVEVVEGAAGSSGGSSGPSTGTGTGTIPGSTGTGKGYGPGAFGDITGALADKPIWSTVDLTNDASSVGGSVDLFGNTVVLNEEELAKLTEQVPDWFITGVKPKPSPGPDPSGGNFSGNPNVYGLPSVFDIGDITKPVGPAITIDDLTDGNLSKTVLEKSANFSNAANPCRRDFDIEPTICKSLGLTTNTNGDLVVGQPMTINVNPKDTVGNKLPAKTKFKISKTTDGKFKSKTGKDLTTTALLSDFPISVVGSTKAGKITVEVDSKDPAYASICKGEIKVVKEEEFVCKSLNLTAVKYTKTQGGAKVNPSATLELNKIKSINPSNVKEINFTTFKQLIEQNKNMSIVPKSFIPDFKVGETVVINIAPIDTNGKKLPANTKIKITNSTGGKLIDKNGTTINDLVTLSSFPLTLKETTKEGTVTIGIDPSDPNYSKDCIGTIKVVKEEELLECKSLSYILNKKTATLGDILVNQLEKNNIYTVSASSVYSKNHEDVINFSIDPDYGTFIKSNLPISTIENWANGLKVSGNLKKEFFQMLPAFNATFANEVSVSGNQKIVLVIFDNNLLAKNNILKMNSQGFSNIECKKEVPIIVPVGECQALILAPNSLNGNSNTEYTVSAVQHTGSIKITLTGTSTGISKGTLTKILPRSAVQSGKEITFSKDEVANAANTPLKFTYTADTSFDKTKDVVELLAQAINKNGQVAPQCQVKLNTIIEVAAQECIDLEITNPDSPWEPDDGDDNQLFQIDVTTNPNTLKNDLYYHWEVSDCDDCEWDDTDDKTISDKGDFSKMLNGMNIETDGNDSDEPIVNIWATKTINASDVFKDSNGNQICKDYIKAKVEEEEEEEQPEIEKWSFKTTDLNDADDVTNISEDTDYVTFMAVFNIGKGPKSILIEDLNLKSLGGNEYGIAGDKGGKLVFKNMIINIIESDKDQDKYTILETNNYQDNSTNGKFDEFSDDEMESENLKDYICESANDINFCIDLVEMNIADDYDEAKDLKDLDEDKATEKIADKFKNGDPIAFKNLNKLEDNSKIVIKYQLDNQTAIDDEECAKLNPPECGEEFKNKIRFKSYEDGDFKGDDFEDSDYALVIAICPYILTRQGGDVFFHDVIKTGIDVAQCAEVKGGQGPGVTPEKPTPGEVPKTGQGDPNDLIKNKLKLELPSHDICRFSNLAGNVEGYNNVLENFSSTICELRAEVAQAWKLENINKAITANIKRIARFADSTTLGSTGVIYQKDSNYTVNATKVNNWKDSEPAAKTIIVENGNLVIEDDIMLYDDPASSKARSMAFIVINGNIIVNNTDIKRLDGVFISIDTNLTDIDKKGQIMQTGVSKIPLTINGNLIGNVYELFKNRQGVGDPSKDEGSVTIKYSSRLLLNPPPGLNELLNIQQALVP